MNDVVWQTVPFEQLVEFHDRRRIPLSKRERADRSGPFPYYGAQGIIDWLDDFIFDGRYLLIAEDGENLNSRKQPVAFVADGRFWVNNHAHVVKAIDGLADDDFLRAYVEFHPLNGLITGAAQPKLSQTNLKRLQVAAPPYPVQARIGSVIRALDDLIDNNRRRIEILEEMARLLYREWFVHFRFPGHEDVELVDSELGPIPEGWEVVALAEYANYINRGIAPKYSDDSEQIVINQRCIRDGRLTLDKARRHVKKVPPEKVVQEGDVLINSTGVGTLGRVAPVREAIERATVDSHVTIVRPPTGESNDFFAQLLLALQPRFEAMGAGSTGQTELARARVGEVDVVRPPVRLTELFGARTAPMRSLHVNLTQQNRVLREARDLLLPRLVSGELDVSELDLDGVLA